MTAFQKAEVLATQRYDRDKLLASVDEVTTHFRMPNSFERSKMRAVCRYLADALDRLQRINSATALERFREEVLAEVGGCAFPSPIRSCRSGLVINSERQ